MPKEVAVPHGAARRPVVDADAAAAERTGVDVGALPGIEIANREIAQREDGDRDERSVAAIEALDVLRHRGLPSVHGGIVGGASQHVVALAAHPRQREIAGTHVAGGDGQEADVV